MEYAISTRVGKYLSYQTNFKKKKYIETSCTYQAKKWNTLEGAINAFNKMPADMQERSIIVNVIRDNGIPKVLI